MRKRTQVVSVGEILVDFVSSKPGAPLEKIPQFEKHAGGGPANVSVGIARLGTSSAFVGKVGDDSFGRFLVNELRAAGVNTRGIRSDSRFKTRLAFVSLGLRGDREFEFWERFPADEQLCYEDIAHDLVSRSRIVNIGSFLLLRNPSRNTAMRVARDAAKMGCDVSFDPNLRLSLWGSRGEARRVLTAMIRRASIVRLNQQEAHFFARTSDLAGAAERIRSFGPKLVAITLAEKGCFVQTRTVSQHVRGYRVEPVDTTGCGDGFLAGLLHGLANREKQFDELRADDLHCICRLANAVGAYVAARRGAISAMPTARQLSRFRHKNGDAAS